MITGINESKTLAKDISCECKCKFDGRKCNSDRWWNNDKCRCECRKHYLFEKDCLEYIYGKYLASIMDDSAIICDEVIKSYNEKLKTIPTNFNERKYNL